MVRHLFKMGRKGPMSVTNFLTCHLSVCPSVPVTNPVTIATNNSVTIATVT